MDSSGGRDHTECMASTRRLELEDHTGQERICHKILDTDTQDRWCGVGIGDLSEMCKDKYIQQAVPVQPVYRQFRQSPVTPLVAPTLEL